MKRLLILLVMFTFAAIGAADTIYVPDDHGTIQGAIVAALDGDTIIVRPATYEENIDFLGKAITVKSELGPELTIIDGSDPVNPDYGSVVTMMSGEGLDSVLDGFTLSYGTGNYYPDSDETAGGGIMIELSSPTIINNIISENTADGGAGINCYDNSSPVISNNTFTANAAGGGGGGIFCWEGSSPLITGNTFTENTGLENGGGAIGCYLFCSPTIANNVFTLNAATGEYSLGGAVGCIGQCDPVISNNVFDLNSSPNEGGALAFLTACDPTIENNIITNNSAGDAGGGMTFWTGCHATITNNLISGNTCQAVMGSGWGGGINSYSSILTLANNTITGNSAELVGGGISLLSNSAATISNTILWANDAPVGSEGYVGEQDELTISFSDVFGGQDSIKLDPGATLNWGAGMIDADPLFYLPADDDYHLQQDPCQPGVVNPCVDAGNPFSPMIAGTTRSDCGPDVDPVDMGYHYALLDTVSADLGCVPDSGVLPFAVQLSVTLGNVVDYDRTIAGRINLTLAGGATYQSWRAGYTNLGPNEMFVTTWMQTLPALGSLVGGNVFVLHAEDVTPPPFNQPPFPPSGDIDTASCTVTGEASTR